MVSVSKGMVWPECEHFIYRSYSVAGSLERCNKKLESYLDGRDTSGIDASSADENVAVGPVIPGQSRRHPPNFSALASGNTSDQDSDDSRELASLHPTIADAGEIGDDFMVQIENDLFSTLHDEESNAPPIVRSQPSQGSSRKQEPAQSIPVDRK